MDPGSMEAEPQQQQQQEQFTFPAWVPQRRMLQADDELFVLGNAERELMANQATLQVTPAIQSCQRFVYSMCQEQTLQASAEGDCTAATDNSNHSSTNNHWVLHITEQHLQFCCIPLIDGRLSMCRQSAKGSAHRA